MDILGRYNKENPEVQAPQWQPPSEYSFLIRMVMKLSGGKIREEKQANYVLLIVTISMVAVSLLLFMVNRPAKFSEDWKPYYQGRLSR